MRLTLTIVTSKKSYVSSSKRRSRSAREHRRDQVVLGERGKRDRIESRPFLSISIVEVDVQRVMFGIDARRWHRNQTPLMEEPSTVDDEKSNAPLSRIDDHAVECADFLALNPHIERLDERSLEAAALEEAKPRRVGFVHRYEREQFARHHECPPQGRLFSRKNAPLSSTVRVRLCGNAP